MVHSERDILAKVPAKERKKLSRYLKQIFNAADKEMAMTVAKIISDKYRDICPKVSKMLNEDLEGVLTFYDYPEKHRRKIRTTNLIEWLNKMIKERSMVIGVFPNAESYIRYVSCLLMEIDEDWQTGRRYMRMDYLEEDKDFLDEEIMEEIEKVKEVIRTNEELVAH